MIRELRVLPPLAIARFGAADTPLDNYDAVVDPERPLGHRALRPAETLEVDVDTGQITRAFVPERLTFTDDGKVRPVAPFLELWALTDGGELEAVTTELLEAEGASASDVRWRVQVANHKVFRRTAAEGDKVQADSGSFSDHGRRAVLGECANFWPGRTIPLGHVQYIRPTEAHPEIRLRFTPAAGFVYGANEEEPRDGPPADPNVRAVVYDANRGGWLGYTDDVPGRPVTVPAPIYASDRQGRSRGYLDDGCDGFARVMLSVGDRTLSAFARVGAGPPTYAPDAVPIRTVADELEQALLGPDVEPGEATFERAEEIVRRAFETIRLMNTAVMNVEGMVSHDSRGSLQRREDPIMATSLVDEAALESLHQSLLVALRAGAAPWFADVVLRHDEIGDLSDRGRRRMPAMMRGADGRHLALTRRQVELVRMLVRGPIFPDRDGGAP